MSGGESALVATGAPLRPWRLAAWKWAIAVLVFVGIGAALYSFHLLNVAPRVEFWPEVFVVDRSSVSLLQPLSGDGAFQTLVLKGWLDSLVPFVPWMIVPYLAALVIAPIVVPLLNLAVGSFRRFLTVGLALIVGQLFLDLAYYLFQSSVIRDVAAGDGLVGDVIRQMWDFDAGFNKFPSAHCTWATIALLSLWRLRRRLPVTSWLLMAALVPVFPATVMLQQNYVIDVYAAVFVGFATYWACMFLVERPQLVPSNEAALPGRRQSERVPTTVTGESAAPVVAASVLDIGVVEMPVPEPWGDAQPCPTEAPFGTAVVGDRAAGGTAAPSDPDADQRAIAVASYNRCWDLLDIERRSADDDAELLTCAFTSRYHWFVVGDEQAKIVAEWMVSRAAAAVDEPDLAITFGRRSLALLGRADQPAWLRASVYEGLARAYASAGDEQRRGECLNRAKAELEAEIDPDDRDLIAAQIATVPDV